MSTTAGLLLTALSGTAVTYNNTLSTLEKHNTRSTNKNCEHTNTQNTFSTELNLRLSRSSSQQNLDTDSGKSSCSPALLDSSFDSGIVVGAKHILKGEEMVECSVVEQQIDATSSAKSVKTESCAVNNTITTNCYNGIGTDTSSNAVEEMRQKLRNERLQQWRLILLELDRQGDPHRRLRERLSKVCERKIFKKGSTNDCICNVCCCQIDQSDSKSVVSCCVCNKKVCRGAKCSTWLPKPGCWECQLCKSSNHSLSHTQSWVAEQMSFNHKKNVYPMKARSEIYIPIGDCNESSMHFENTSHVGENCAITAGQKLKIREYVEEVVAKLLGGSLDQIRVNQLSKSENYLPGILNNSTLPQSTVIVNGNSSNKKQNVNKLPEFSEISQKRLRYMIESIISETLRMPPLANGSVSEVALNTYTQSNEAVDRLPLENGKLRLRHHYRTDNYFEPKIYQDLLATAVLNKIADKEGNIRQLSESTPDLSSRHIDSKFNLEKDSTSSGSSVEPRSDFSYTDTEQAPKIIKVPGRESALSDYIAGHKVPLPDLSAAATESEEEDHASVSSSIIAEGTWENNWLFKKKGSLSASLTGSVGMLVPAPKDDVRAQIGDKTADEISDLSEIGSDTDDSSLHIASGNLDHLNNRILSKHLIGGQNTKVVLDELIETASLVSNTPKMPNEPEYTEAKNEHILEATKKTEAINSTYSNEHIPLSDQLSTDSNRTEESTPTSVKSLLAEHNIKQELLHTNKFNNISINNTKLTNGSYPNLNPSNLLKITNVSENQDFINSTEHQQYIKSNNDNDNDDDHIDVGLFKHLVPGSIAEREYKKWNNAVEMPNNPYAPEALKRRISGSQERFIDLPNIISSTEKIPITLSETTKLETNVSDENYADIDYKRYSRDYYINNDKANKTSLKHEISTSTTNKSNSSVNDEHTADIVINEVNCNGNTINKNITLHNENSDCHWSLSTPVRRSSSLKFINRCSPLKSYNNNNTNSNSINPINYQKHQIPPRPLTSASHYDHLDRIHLQNNISHNDNTKYINRYSFNNFHKNNISPDMYCYNDIKNLGDYNDDDVRSNSSWRSANAATNYSSTLPKHRAQSSLSIHSSTSGASLNSTISKKRALSNTNTLSEFEKQLLHKDLKRNSFRAISATSKDFVMNPLFERDNVVHDNIIMDSGADNTAIESNIFVKRNKDEQIDSGIDSCLNGFNETEFNLTP